MNAGMIGTATMAATNNWSWRIPLLLQSFFPLIVCSLIYFTTPESPRYLIMKGKREKAKEVIAKYMTTSESTSDPLVSVVVAQIEESLETSRTGFRQSWNFAVFLTSKISLLCAVDFALMNAYSPSLCFMAAGDLLEEC